MELKMLLNECITLCSSFASEYKKAAAEWFLKAECHKRSHPGIATSFQPKCQCSSKQA